MASSPTFFFSLFLAFPWELPLISGKEDIFNAQLSSIPKAEKCVLNFQLVVD
jgi:hypothetical protein